MSCQRLARIEAYKAVEVALFEQPQRQFASDISGTEPRAFFTAEADCLEMDGGRDACAAQCRLNKYACNHTCQTVIVAAYWNRIQMRCHHHHVSLVQGWKIVVEIASGVG